MNEPVVTKISFIALMIGAMILSTVRIGFAGIAGSKHDMYGGPVQHGTNPKICTYCHVPHNAAGNKIWSTWANEAQLTGGPSTTIGNMCYTCHDGTVTSIGQLTAFNTARQQHKISAGKDCDMCHTVHDNTNGMFSIVPETQSAATAMPTYCETCHDDTMFPGAEPLGDHLAGSEHPYKHPTSPYLSLSCKSCHVAHGAGNYNYRGLSNPIVRYNQYFPNSEWCFDCHSGPYYNMTGGVQHPAFLTTPGTWGKVECEDCHDPHQPFDVNRTALLADDNIDSALCKQCHDVTDETNGPAIGGSHPYDIPLSMTPADPALTPVGNIIDDDNDSAIDYPLNSSNMICETCHSVHTKGLAVPLLRESDGGALCLNCHVP